MKKIFLIIVAVVCCISIVIAGVSLAMTNNLSQQVEHLSAAASATYNLGTIERKLDELREELNVSEFDFSFGSGSEIYWSDVPVRQGQVEIEDSLCLLGSQKVLWTYNLEYAAPNHYEIVNPTETAYVLVENTTTGVVALLNVVKNH